ncbi:MAG TPA: FtsX-like permease family protein [Candidatus Acidoferrales bacterium]|nr:FtsX-like permease family protein [Candidatus Acidoferrales bacterium]
MKYLPLIWANLRRKRVRTFFTLLSILVAFLLFGYLAAVRGAFDIGIQIAGVDRLVLTHKQSIILPLPLSYQDRIETVPGVVEVANATWFGGVYQDAKNGVAEYAVDPERYLKLYPEFILPEDQKKAWLADRTGAICGDYLAKKFGWKIGDRIPFTAPWQHKDGSNSWEFTLDGIYTVATKAADNTQFLIHWKYLDEGRVRRNGYVGWYIVRIANPEQAPEMVKSIDGLFANSDNETKTSTEKAFMQGFAKQVGNIGAIITAILSVVFFVILLVAGNTMMQSVRERITELAVLKTVGFPNGLILTLVLCESLMLAVLGGALGMGLAWLLISRGDPTNGALPIFFMPPSTAGLAAVFILLLGLATGALPAVQAMRLRVVEALRRG